MPFPITNIHISSDFKKSFKNLPKNLQELTTIKDKMFRINPFDKSLRTHKLKGELEGFWAYSVNYKYRILFRFIFSDEVVYYDIGTHEIYQ